MINNITASRNYKLTNKFQVFSQRTLILIFKTCIYPATRMHCTAQTAVTRCSSMPVVCRNG